MSNKQKVMVVYGGPGEEHEVSLRSGKNIFDSIDKNIYEAEENIFSKTFSFFSKDEVKRLRTENIIVFPVMHGKFGEGGEFQKRLEKSKIKFVGSRSKVSALCMDKLKTQKILEKNNILVPQTYFIKKISELSTINFLDNYIVKPLDGGSSVDLAKAKSLNELVGKVEEMLEKYGECLVQEFVSGREFTCGVVQVGKKLVALPVSEIVLTETEIFNYKAKYTAAACQEITPAKIDKKLQSRIQQTSKKVFKVLGCKDIGRVDLIVNKKNEIVVLEINTMPGMTDTSFIPQQLKAFGKNTTWLTSVLLKN